MTNQHLLPGHYRYDPLDRLAHVTPANQDATRFFYRRSRLVTQVQGPVRSAILYAGDQPLSQHQRATDTLSTILLATDTPRSVLAAVARKQYQALAYTAYGHAAADNGLASLLGFNGERGDPLTGHYLLGNGYRAFNPVLMCFNSPDSLSPFSKGGINAYAYCQGDPVNGVDADGHLRMFSFTRKNMQRVAAGVSIAAGAAALIATVVAKEDPLKTILPIAGAALIGIGLLVGFKSLPIPSARAGASRNRVPASLISMSVIPDNPPPYSSASTFPAPASATELPPPSYRDALEMAHGRPTGIPRIRGSLQPERRE